MSERVRRHGLGDPGTAGGLADDPPGTVRIPPAAVRGQEHLTGTGANAVFNFVGEDATIANSVAMLRPGGITT